MEEIISSKLLQDILSKKNIQLTLDIKNAAAEIIGDKIKIRQFFMCLIEVISFYHENRGIIAIRVSNKDFVEITYRTLSERCRKRFLHAF